MRDLIARKEIKAVKIGQWKIKPEDLEEFIESRKNVKSGVILPKSSEYLKG